MNDSGQGGVFTAFGMLLMGIGEGTCQGSVTDLLTLI
jgi:hypothetical protein